MKQVNVLGTEYRIITDDSIISQDADGLCKQYEKEISIRSKCNLLCQDDSDEIKEIRYKEVLRHELIHAFLMNQVLMITAAMNSLLIGLLHSFPRCRKRLKKLIAYEC